MDKIVARARSWASRALSYAGRLQLINSILFAIQTYWSPLFILPKSVIKQVEQVLRNFLWKGSDLSHGGAKVAWASICLPKQEGGLGLALMMGRLVVLLPFCGLSSRKAGLIGPSLHL